MAYYSARQYRLASHRAGANFLKALDRFGRWYFSSKFSADQPRAPAGSPEGGQWISDGSGDPIIELIAGITSEQMDMSVQSFVSAFCKGSINEVLPSEFLDEKIGSVAKLAKAGDAKAKSCMKLLGRERFRK